MTASKPKVSVIGLGKLGLPLALSFASHHLDVVGYDVIPSWILKLQKGKAPINEPMVQDHLTKWRTNLQFTLDLARVCESTNISFIVVPTPSKEDGSFSSRYIENVFRSIASHIKRKKDKHILVITSTLSPLTMDNILRPLIEKLTGKKVGIDLGLCYSPELIALGSVIHNLENPDFLIIGESDPDSGHEIEVVRRAICENSPQVIRTNWINVELAKLSLNAYITTKISFANMIARISERIPGADSEVILNAIGQDTRVGAKYLKGGLGYGGPCFPRDNVSLATTVKNTGLDILLPHNTDTFNRKQVDYIYKAISKYLSVAKTVGILGLSYKQDTDVTDESQGILLANKLSRKGKAIVVYDPLVHKNAKTKLNKALFMDSAEECVRRSDIAIITTPWDQFKEIDWNTYKDKVVVDCWRVIDLPKYDQKRNVFVQLGRYIPTP